MRRKQVDARTDEVKFVGVVALSIYFKGTVDLTRPPLQ